jgi:8-oxo-dGTP diphosphatase
VSTSLLLVVAVVLYDHAGRILLAQRPEGKSLAGLWELPGGKLEAGESPEVALQRELQEELSIGIALKDLKPLTFASFAYPSFHLLMPIFVCRHWSGEVSAGEGQALAWVHPADLGQYPAPPADIDVFAMLSGFRENGTQ